MKDEHIDQLFKKAQALGEDIREMESVDVYDAYSRALVTIKNKKRKHLYMRLTQYAAILMLPLLLSTLVFGYLYLKEPAYSDKYVDIKVPAGSIIRYELPDNSVVWLNSGSSLYFPTVFNKECRSVQLTGEAYFEVEGDKKKPFCVKTPEGQQIYVYGTKFNVSAFGDENSVETVLEEGIVNVISPDGKASFQLAPGEQAIYNKEKQKLSKSEVDVYEKVAWKDGKLVFRNASLAQIFKRLSRHFNVEIEYNNNVNIEVDKYRATFHGESLSQIMNYLARSSSFEWRMEEPVQQDTDAFTQTKIIVNLHETNTNK